MNKLVQIHLGSQERKDLPYKSHNTGLMKTLRDRLSAALARQYGDGVYHIQVVEVRTETEEVKITQALFGVYDNIGILRDIVDEETAQARVAEQDDWSYASIGGQL